MHRPLILASSSPRRKELLAHLQLPFTTIPSHADESVEQGTPPSDVVQILAERKARQVAQLPDVPNGSLVIGSDTIVVLDGCILGKPADEEDALRMLLSLQGRSHFVYTGLSIVDCHTMETETSFRQTEVFMRAASQAELESYVHTQEPMDKAGAYGIQGLGSVFVTHINGDYYTVVGLPLALVSNMLQRFDVRVL